MSDFNPLIWQYRGKPKAVKTVTVLHDESASVMESAVNMSDVLNIDKATGFSLDLVGAHVGTPRQVQQYIPRKYFGFYGLNGEAFGVGRFYRYGEPQADSTYLTDDDYRFTIKAKILKNYQDATLSNIARSMRMLLGDGAQVYDGLDMTMAIVVPEKSINDFRMFAIMNLDIMVRPVGVYYRFITSVPENYFGFSNDPNSKGFGVGKFARIYNVSTK